MHAGMCPWPVGTLLNHVMDTQLCAGKGPTFQHQIQVTLLSKMFSSSKAPSRCNIAWCNTYSLALQPDGSDFKLLLSILTASIHRTLSYNFSSFHNQSASFKVKERIHRRSPGWRSYYELQTMAAAKQASVDDAVAAVLSELGGIFSFQHKNSTEGFSWWTYFLLNTPLVLSRDSMVHSVQPWGGEAMLMLHSNYSDWPSWK